MRQVEQTDEATKAQGTLSTPPARGNANVISTQVVDCFE